MFNRVRGNLPGMDCPDCLNRGYIHFVNDAGQLSTRDCRCMTIRRNERRIDRSGLRDMMKRYTFDNWQTPHPWQVSAAMLAQRYAAERSGWFLVTGTPGTGKTHLCTAICGTLLEAGVDVRYMLWRDVSVKAKAVVNDEEEYHRIMDPLKSVHVLYIDDLFKTGRGQEPSTGDVNLAFELLNARYNDSSKLTIISTERSMDDLLNIDEATGSRIYERSKRYYLDLSGKGNWRLM